MGNNNIEKSWKEKGLVWFNSQEIEPYIQGITDFKTKALQELEFAYNNSNSEYDAGLQLAIQIIKELEAN